MGKSVKFDREEYEASVLAEVRAEMAKNDHRCLEGLRLVEFTSRSNGADRNPRPSRQVTLVVYGKTAYSVVGGEIRRRKDGRSPDSLAQEALSHLPEPDRTADNLLTIARKRNS